MAVIVIGLGNCWLDHWFVAAAEQYLGDTKALLLRANLLKHDFAQKQGEGQEAHGRGSRRGGHGGGGGGRGSHASAYLGALGNFGGLGGIVNPDAA